MIGTHEPAPTLLLTPRAAARALAVSERTLWTLSKAGEIPRIMVGRAVRYSVRDLETYIARNRVIVPT